MSGAITTNESLLKPLLGIKNIVNKVLSVITKQSGYLGKTLVLRTSFDNAFVNLSNHLLELGQI
jgi:hypothetical protein